MSYNLIIIVFTTNFFTFCIFAIRILFDSYWIMSLITFNMNRVFLYKDTDESIFFRNIRISQINSYQVLLHRIFDKI